MEEKFPKMEVDKEGNKRWKNEKGELHREDGPAVEYAYGRKVWYHNGKRHREDGPAVEYPGGGKSWYLNGTRYSEEDYHKKLAEMKKSQFPKMEIDQYGNKIWKNEKGQLHREDGPAIEHRNGSKSWVRGGKLHRENGPAIERANGDKEWYRNGKYHREDGPAIEFKGKCSYWYFNGIFHREDGPAVEHANGEKYWYLNGIRYSEEGYHKKLAEMKKSEFPKMTIDKEGNKTWRNEKEQYHREDGPAVERANGHKEWWLKGELHREDGPAIEYTDGDKHWYLNGKRHREDGPAVEECTSGDKIWFLNGTRYSEEDYHKKLAEMKKSEFPKVEIDKYSNKRWRNEKGQCHREDGPAVECHDGRKYWYLNGELHREDGPAMEYPDGSKAWYLNGIQYSEEVYRRKLTEVKPEYPKMDIDKEGNKRWFKKKGELHREDGPAVEFADGFKEWYLDGELHREDGPAIESAYGSYWYLNGKCHREDGPAIEHANGHKEWRINGKLHREDGPAIEWADGDKQWWLNGVKYSEEEYHKKLAEMKKSEFPKMEIDSCGTKHWRNEQGRLHREDGPAIERADGTKYWYRDGKCHREDGPALEYPDGSKAWFLNGIEYSEEDYHQKLAEMKKSEYPKMEIDRDGNKRWKNEKRELHREDGPAFEMVNGTKFWYLNDNRHREDGPAVEWANGNKEWWLNGIKYSEEEYHKKLTEMKKSEFPKMTIDKDGNKSWYNEKGELHREDGPAFEYADGRKVWSLNGLLHRGDGPAVEGSDGSKLWSLNGVVLSEEDYHEKLAEMKKSQFPKMEIDKDGSKWWFNEKRELHREDGPAIERADGSKIWYLNGKCHREDGPAVEDSNGAKTWYRDGKRHREDGPAFEFANHGRLWYLNGIAYSEEEYHQKLAEMKKSEFPKMEIDKNGTKIWRNEKGKFHREDGPAVEYPDGRKYWYLNGKPHREDGPAIEFANRGCVWYLNGVQYTEEEDYWQALKARRKPSKASEAIMAQEDARILADLKGVSNVGSKEDKMSFSDKVKSDAVDASYRVARKQIMNIVRNGLLKAMEKNKVKKAQVKAFAEFLTTDLGEAMMLGMVGYGADFVPGLKDNHIVQKLAKEARVEGMAMAGNFVVESVASTILPEVMGVLSTLTESEKRLRIESSEVKIAPEVGKGNEDEVSEEEEKSNVLSLKRS